MGGSNKRYTCPQPENAAARSLFIDALKDAEKHIRKDITDSLVLASRQKGEVVTDEVMSSFHDIAHADAGSSLILKPEDNKYWFPPQFLWGKRQNCSGREDSLWIETRFDCYVEKCRLKLPQGNTKEPVEYFVKYVVEGFGQR